MSALSTAPEQQHSPTPADGGHNSPRPGDLLVGRYRLQAVIGVGGMARVFRARDERLEREVAVKINHHSIVTLQREERIASALFHPNIVPIFDGGEIPAGEPGAGAGFVVMEHVAGTTAHVAAPVGWRRAVEIVGEAADGLAAAHARGIIHNDIKPSNILLDRAGRARLVDFGVAATAQSEVGDFVHGSPAYIAPERLRGERPNPRHDVYGLGGVLAYLISGQHPQSRVPALPADCPAPLADLIAIARALDPTARHADAADFRRALDAAVPSDGEDRLLTSAVAPPRQSARRPTAASPRPRAAVRARRPSAPAVAPAAAPRPRLHATLAALALALLLALGGGLVVPRLVASSPIESQAAAPATSMPDLAGQNFGAAIDQLTQHGLTVERVDVVYGPGPPNQVVAQTPGPGQRLHEGDSVRLVVRTDR